MDRSSKPSLRATVGTGPGDAITGHSPGIFLKADLADLKPTAADPAELLTMAAAMALEGATGFPGAGLQLKGLIHRDGSGNR